jgi:hypothetical protein
VITVSVSWLWFYFSACFLGHFLLYVDQMESVVVHDRGNAWIQYDLLCAAECFDGRGES